MCVSQTSPIDKTSQEASQKKVLKKEKQKWVKLQNGKKYSKQYGVSCARSNQVTLVLPLMGPHSPAPHTPTGVVGMYG